MSRELDVWIAEHVMGFDQIHDSQNSGVLIGYDPHSFTYVPVPRYSTDPAAAYEVLERLNDDSWLITITMSECGGTDVKLECGAQARGRYYSDLMEGEVYTFAEAICVAAKRAIEEWPIGTKEKT